jgi:hypothetical protein
MAATTVLRWLHPRSGPPIVQRVIVEPEEQLALRNQQRLEQAKRALGGRYVLHRTTRWFDNVKSDRARWSPVRRCRTKRANQGSKFRPSATPESTRLAVIGCLGTG